MKCDIPESATECGSELGGGGGSSAGRASQGGHGVNADQIHSPPISFIWERDAELSTPSRLKHHMPLQAQKSFPRSCLHGESDPNQIAIVAVMASNEAVNLHVFFYFL